MESNLSSEDSGEFYENFRSESDQTGENENEQQEREDTSGDTDTQMQPPPQQPLGKKRMSKAERKKNKKLNKAVQNREKVPLQICCLKAVHNWTQELQELRKQLGEMEKRYNNEKRLREEFERKMQILQSELQNNREVWFQQLQDNHELAWQRVKGLEKIISQLVVDLRLADDQIHQMLDEFLQMCHLRAAAAQAVNTVAIECPIAPDFAVWQPTEIVQPFPNIDEIQIQQQLAAAPQPEPQPQPQPEPEPEINLHANQFSDSDVVNSMQNLQVEDTDTGYPFPLPSTGGSGNGYESDDFTEFPAMPYHIRAIERLLESPSDHMFDDEDSE